jgi:hypothetical protein
MAAHTITDLHPDTLMSLNNLAFLLRAQGDFAGARLLFERALAIHEKVLGGIDRDYGDEGEAVGAADAGAST